MIVDFDDVDHVAEVLGRAERLFSGPRSADLVMWMDALGRALEVLQTMLVVALVWSDRPRDADRFDDPLELLEEAAEIAAVPGWWREWWEHPSPSRKDRDFIESRLSVRAAWACELLKVAIDEIRFLQEQR